MAKVEVTSLNEFLCPLPSQCVLASKFHYEDNDPLDDVYLETSLMSQIWWKYQTKCGTERRERSDISRKVLVLSQISNSQMDTGNTIHRLYWTSEWWRAEQRYSNRILYQANVCAESAEIEWEHLWWCPTVQLWRTKIQRVQLSLTAVTLEIDGRVYIVMQSLPVCDDPRDSPNRLSPSLQ